jgi:hypothetical protein
MMHDSLTQPVNSPTKLKGNEQKETIHTRKSQCTVTSEHFRSVTLEVLGDVLWCHERPKVLMKLYWSEHTILMSKELFRLWAALVQYYNLSITKLLPFTKAVLAVRYARAESVVKGALLLFLHDQIFRQSWQLLQETIWIITSEFIAAVGKDSDIIYSTWVRN